MGVPEQLQDPAVDNASQDSGIAPTSILYARLEAQCSAQADEDQVSGNTAPITNILGQLIMNCPNVHNDQFKQFGMVSVMQKMEDEEIPAGFGPKPVRERRENYYIYDEIKENGWIIFKDKVYDVTVSDNGDENWMENAHPGGIDIIKMWQGRDATLAFTQLHPEEVIEAFLQDRPEDLNIPGPKIIGYLEDLDGEEIEGIKHCLNMASSGVPISKVFQFGNYDANMLRALCRAKKNQFGYVQGIHHYTKTEEQASVPEIWEPLLSEEQANKIALGVVEMLRYSQTTKKATNRGLYLDIFEEYYGSTIVHEWLQKAQIAAPKEQWLQDYDTWHSTMKEEMDKLMEEDYAQCREEIVEELRNVGRLVFWEQGLEDERDSHTSWKRFQTEELGLVSMDDAHGKIDSAFDKCRDDLKNGKEEEWETNLSNIQESLLEHFKEEETLMSKMGYPTKVYVVHQTQHLNFNQWTRFPPKRTNKMTDKEWLECRIEFVSKCKQRFENHSHYGDSRYVRFCCDKKYRERVMAGTGMS